MKKGVHAKHIPGKPRAALLGPDSDMIPHLRERVAALRTEAEHNLALFREAMLPFAEAWMREAAKAVAVAQDEHTIQLGRQGIVDLKRSIRDFARSLTGAIEDEFTAEDYLEAEDASSGQIKRLIGRRFDRGMRRVLATLYPLLEQHGFAKDEHWIDVEGHRGYPVTLDLPPDIRDQVRGIIDAITDIKVCESKIVYYKRQRGREIAAELWDSV